MSHFHRFSSRFQQESSVLPCGLLLNRHALCQIPRLVYVAASADGYVVGEELEGDYFQDGEEEFVGLGDVDGVFD